MERHSIPFPCSRCGGKNITSTQIIYVGNIELALYSSNTPIDDKDFLVMKAPNFPHGLTF